MAKMKNYLTAQDLQHILPHRFPMLMVDKIIDIIPGESAIGIKNVTQTEYYFPGHFPSCPIMPGVFIIEAMAQTAAAFAQYTENIDAKNKIIVFLDIEKAKFRSPVRPGDQLKIHIKYLQKRFPIWKFSAKAYIDEKLAVEAQFKAMLSDPI